MSLLSQLLTLVYQDINNGNHGDQSTPITKLTVKDIHSMVLSHSQFLPIMLSKGNPLDKGIYVSSDLKNYYYY